MFVEKTFSTFTDAIDFVSNHIKDDFLHPQNSQSTLIIVHHRVEIVWFKKFFISNNIPLMNVKLVLYEFVVQNISDYLHFNQLFFWNTFSREIEHVLLQQTGNPTSTVCNNIYAIKINSNNINGTNQQQSNHFPVTVNFVFTNSFLDQIEYLLSHINPDSTTGIVIADYKIYSLLQYFLSDNNIDFHSSFFEEQIHSVYLFAKYWIQFQSDQTIDNLLIFLNLLLSLHQITSHEFEKIVQEVQGVFDVYPIINIKNLAVLCHMPLLQSVLQRYPLLNDYMTFAEFKRSIPINTVEEFNDCVNDSVIDTKENFLSRYREFFQKNYLYKDIHKFCNLFLINTDCAKNLYFDQLFIISDRNHPIYNVFHAKDVCFVNNIKEFHPSLFLLYKYYTGFKLDTRKVNIYTKKYKISLVDHSNYVQKNNNAKDNTNNSTLFNYNNDYYYHVDTPNLNLSATAIENLYEYSENVLFKNILKIAPKKIESSKAKIAGMTTHKLIELCTKNNNFNIHNLDIISNEYFQSITESFKANNIKIPSTLAEVLSMQNAAIMLQKLSKFKTILPNIITETKVSGRWKLSTGEIIDLHGRVDCILSKLPFVNYVSNKNSNNDILIVDFKTGKTSQKDLQKLTKTISDKLPTNIVSFQVVLYGLILRSLGYRNIDLLIINSNPYEDFEPIPLVEYLTDNNLQVFYELFLQLYLKTGIFPKNSNNSFSLVESIRPLAINIHNVKNLNKFKQNLFAKILQN